MSYVDQINQELHEHIKALEEDAGNTRQLQNWTQLTGYAAAVIGAMAIPSPISWFAAIPAGVGLFAAISQTIAEAKLTGRLQIFPFMDASPELLGSLLTAETRGDVQDESIDDYMYLTPRRRSEFAMVMYCGHSIATLLAGIEHPVTQRSVYQQLCRVFHRQYGRYVRCTPFLDRGMEARGLNYQAPSAVFKQLSLAIKLPEVSQQLIDSGVNKDNSIGLTTRFGGIEEDVVDTQVIEAPTSSLETPEDMLKRLVHMPLFMIVSPQGCGKSTTLQWLATYAAQIGWRVIVADPHYEFGTYPNLPVFGKAKKYSECGELIETILDIVNQRYEERSTKPKEQRNLVPYLFILDEFTSWSRYCKESSEKLIASSLEDFRKAEVHLVFASHGLTKKQTGGADGYYQTLIDSAVVLKLKGKQVATKEGPKLKPLGKAELIEMGESKGIVDMPNLTDWKMPEDLPACDFRLNGEATKDGRDKQPTSEDITPQFEASPWGEVKPTRWSVTQELAADKMPGIATVMTWIDNRNGSPFTLEQARTNNKLRSLIENIDAPGKDVSQKIRSAIKSLVRSDLLKENAEGKLQLTQKAKSRWEG